jgi:hypothetical protein
MQQNDRYVFHFKAEALAVDDLYRKAGWTVWRFTSRRGSKWVLYAPGTTPPSVYQDEVDGPRFNFVVADDSDSK